MKSIYKVFAFALVAAICATACDNATEVEVEYIDDAEFCSYLSLENVYKTIPIVNDFLAGLPDGITMEQTFESLVTWLNSFSCNLDATILTGLDMIWGREQAYGVAFSINDNGTARQLELDFAVANNIPTYSQITGYTYDKQDAIYVKTEYTKVDKIFGFINSLDLDVKYIAGGTYSSSLPADSTNLKYLTAILKAKPYTNDYWVVGHLNWYTEGITFFVQLYDMKNGDYQADWIKTMSDYQFTEYDLEGNTIVFYIPEGTGKQWKTTFEEYDFVDWAELDYTRYTIP